jgi:hypothetical protein
MITESEDSVNREFLSFAIGVDEFNHDVRALLAAPDGILLNPGDIVVSEKGLRYRLMFVRHHCTDEYPEILAIMIALNVTRPDRIMKRITEEVFDWNVKGEENDDTV